MTARMLQPIWTPKDAHEVFERAATVKATEAAKRLVDLDAERTARR